MCENCYDVHLGGKMENVGKQVLSANTTHHSPSLIRTPRVCTEDHTSL